MYGGRLGRWGSGCATLLGALGSTPPRGSGIVPRKAAYYPRGPLLLGVGGVVSDATPPVATNIDPIGGPLIGAALGLDERVPLSGRESIQASNSLVD